MTTNGGFEPVFCTVVPPHVLDKLARNDDPALSGPGSRTLMRDSEQRLINALEA